MLTIRFGNYNLDPAPEGLTPPWVYKAEARAVTRDWHAAWPYRDQADTATRARLDTLHTEEVAKLTPSWSMDADINIPAVPGFQYRPYQKAGVKYALARDATLIADVPRLGKSAQALGVANYLGKPGVLIVCPAVAKPQWRRYCQDWLVSPGEIKVVQGLSDTIPGSADTVIINWDVLSYYQDTLAARVWSVAVFDECRAMANPRSGRTLAALAIKATKRLFLDGTPINTRPKDLWTVVRECDRWDIGRSRPDFMKRYCAAEQPDGSWDPNGASNLEELQRRMRKNFMIRREKKDVVAEIPSTRVPIWLPNDGIDALLNAERYALTGGSDTRSLSEVLEAWADGEITVEPEDLSSVRQALAEAKLPFIYDYVDRLLSDVGKVVVFAYHRAITTALAAHYPNAALVIGGITPTRRQAAIERFQNDPACRVFVGNITACNSAISLAAANDVVYAELSWVPTEMEQSEDRVWLPGKVEPLTAHWLMFEDSADAAMYSIITGRMHDIGKALNRENVT